jgi:hypothetical protein
VPGISDLNINNCIDHTFYSQSDLKGRVAIVLLFAVDLYTRIGKKKKNKNKNKK